MIKSGELTHAETVEEALEMVRSAEMVIAYVKGGGCVVADSMSAEDCVRSDKVSVSLRNSVLGGVGGVAVLGGEGTRLKEMRQ